MAIASRRSLLAAVVATILVSVASSSWAAASGPDSFRHDLRRIDSRLRVAIEIAPVELNEGLLASETVCRLAARTEARGDLEGASAEWTTLARLVDEVDRPPARRIDSAFRRADSGLRALERKYAAGWSDRARVRQLRRGVAATRAGIRTMRAAIAQVEGSFEAWKARRCGAAAAAIEAGSARIPAGLARVNGGMRRLLVLAGL